MHWTVAYYMENKPRRQIAFLLYHSMPIISRHEIDWSVVCQNKLTRMTTSVGKKAWRKMYYSNFIFFRYLRLTSKYVKSRKFSLPPFRPGRLSLWGATKQNRSCSTRSSVPEERPVPPPDWLHHFAVRLADPLTKQWLLPSPPAQLPRACNTCHVCECPSNNSSQLINENLDN